MDSLIQLPRYHIDRKWSPEEILAMQLPSDTTPRNRQNSATEMKKAIAAKAGERGKKKADRKKKILSLISAKQGISTTDLLSAMGEKMNRTTLCELTKELKVEGLIHKIGWTWTSKIGANNDLSN